MNRFDASQRPVVEERMGWCADTAGLFNILAIDHRANLMKGMAKARGRPVGASDIVAFKQAVIRHLAAVSSGMLIDPLYGFPALAAASLDEPNLTAPSGADPCLEAPDSPEASLPPPGASLPPGVLAPLEVTDYSVHPSRRETVLMEGWSVGQAAARGCSGVKLLLYHHPDADNAPAQTRLVDRIVEQCRHHALPFFLEPVGYSLDPAQPLVAGERVRVVVETAEHFSGRGIDVLKVPFPFDAAAEEADWEEALRSLDEACRVPWTLLSGGVPFDLFLRQTIGACRAGASGVIAGRAVWGDGIGLEGPALEAFLSTTARRRMQVLAAACNQHGTPWHAR